MNYEIFILHGWTYSTEKWNSLIDELRQKGFKLNLLKIPGLTEKSDKVWTISDYVEWLRQKINNAIINQTKSKTVLIGHSNGGRIALNFAIKYPNLLSYLILIDSAGIYHEDLVIQTKRVIFKSIAKIAKKITNSQMLRNFLYKIIGERDYKNAKLNMRKTMINLIDSDKFLRYNNVITQTLIIWGRNDKTTPLYDGKMMHRLIKKSKFVVIENAKHSPQFTHAKQVADLIYEHI